MTQKYGHTNIDREIGNHLVDAAAEKFQKRIADETYAALSIDELIKLSFRCGAWYAIDDMQDEILEVQVEG